MAAPPPDLASILRTLSAPQYTQPTAQHPQPLHPSQDYFVRQLPAQHVVAQTPTVQPPPPSGPDPELIMTWPPALRHVTRLLGRNQAAAESIRRLMKSQREHEQQWWEGRERLLKQQRERGEGRKKLEGILKSVGGHVDSSTQGQSPADDESELLMYDTKVHKALTEMEKAFRVELSTMGIPFFVVKKGLVVKEEHSGEIKAEGTTITEVELKVFEKRMIKLLEDLCGD